MKISSPTAPSVETSSVMASISKGLPEAPMSWPVPLTERSMVPAVMSVFPSSVPVMDPLVAESVAELPLPASSCPPAVNKMLPSCAVSVAPTEVTAASSSNSMDSAVTDRPFRESVASKFTTSVPLSPEMVNATVLRKDASTPVISIVSLPSPALIASTAVGLEKTMVLSLSCVSSDWLSLASSSSVRAIVSGVDGNVKLRFVPLRSSSIDSTPEKDSSWSFARGMEPFVAVENM